MLKHQTRWDDRHNIHHSNIRVLASLRASGGHRMNVELRDLSATGFWCKYASELKIGEQVWLKFRDFTAIEVLVKAREGYDYQLSFFMPMHPAMFDHFIKRYGRESI